MYRTIGRVVAWAGVLGFGQYLVQQAATQAEEQELPSRQAEWKSAGTGREAALPAPERPAFLRLGYSGSGAIHVLEDGTLVVEWLPAGRDEMRAFGVSFANAPVSLVNEGTTWRLVPSDAQIEGALFRQNLSPQVDAVGCRRVILLLTGHVTIHTRNDGFLVIEGESSEGTGSFSVVLDVLSIADYSPESANVGQDADSGAARAEEVDPDVCCSVECGPDDDSCYVGNRCRVCTCGCFFDWPVCTCWWWDLFADIRA